MMLITTELMEVECLLWYDGPLMSHYQQGDDHFISLWVDTEELSDDPPQYHDLALMIRAPLESIELLKTNKLFVRDFEEHHALEIALYDYDKFEGEGNPVDFAMMVEQNWAASPGYYLHYVPKE